MAKKGVAAAKVVYTPKTCTPKFVKKANQFAITHIDANGKQVIHWEMTQESAMKKYETLRTA
jgi:predicted peptidase